MTTRVKIFDNRSISGLENQINNDIEIMEEHYSDLKIDIKYSSNLKPYERRDETKNPSGFTYYHSVMIVYTFTGKWVGE